MSGGGPLSQIGNYLQQSQQPQSFQLPTGNLGSGINPYYTQQQPSNSFAPMLGYQQFKQTALMPQVQQPTFEPIQQQQAANAGTGMFPSGMPTSIAKPGDAAPVGANSGGVFGQSAGNSGGK